MSEAMTMIRSKMFHREAKYSLPSVSIFNTHSVVKTVVNTFIPHGNGAGVGGRVAEERGIWEGDDEADGVLGIISTRASTEKGGTFCALVKLFVRIHQDQRRG